MRTLYLIDLGGMRYGIWKDDVRSVSDVPTIHRLPLSPACIAGISVLDGRSIALADLAVCIGLHPMPISEQGRVIFVAGNDTDSGFVVPGPLEEAVIPPDAVFQMPQYVKTAEVDTCIVHGSRPVPVINIAGLYNHLHEGDPNPSAPAFTLPPVRRSGVPARGGVRLFTSGGELFAVSSADVTEHPVRPGSIVPIALMPRHIKGLAFHGGNVIPVVHLADRMGLPARGTPELMMTADLAGSRFGYLIDENRGTLPDDGAAVLPLPPVAETVWTPASVLHRGTVIPLVDPAAVLAVDVREDSFKKLPGRYSPDSRFAAAFEREDVEVVEFSLLGVRHALPKTEVDDIFPFKPYRRIPDALPIVIGVTEHAGEILPVLDLALVFGRRSLESPDWSMILVRNGDFRAFVITERVYGERALPRDVQRKVPIVLPHNLVYGCYPEGVTVRLILNVEALAVHFDKSVVRDLLPALTTEMAAAPAELVPSLLPEEHLREETAATPSRREKEEGVETVQAAAAAFAPAEAEQIVRPEAEEKAGAGVEENLRQATEEEAARRVAEEKARRATEEEQAKREAEAQALRTVEEARSRAEELARQEAEERTQKEAEECRRLEDEARARQEAQERARQEVEEQARRNAEQEKVRREAEELSRQAEEEQAKREAEERATRDAEEARRLAEEKAKQETEEREGAEAEARAKAEEEQKRFESEERVKRETEAQARQAEEDAARRAAKEKARIEAEERAQKEAEERRRFEDEVRARQEAQERARRAAEEQSRRDAEERQRAAAAAVREAEKIARERDAAPAQAAGGKMADKAPSAPSETAPSSEEQHLQQERQGLWKYIAAGILLLALLYAGSQRRAGEDLTGGAVIRQAETEPPARQRDGAGTSARPETVKEGKGPEPGKERKGTDQRGTLVLTVPTDRPIETDVYIVKKGDTLWAICKRFTGNPFNYPRVASDNRIANPDLIFPGQKIMLKKQPPVQ